MSGIASPLRDAPDQNSAGLSRRNLLKAGGALIVGFGLAGQAVAAPAAAPPRGTVAGPPDPEKIDTWIAVHADNTATLYFGKCELGQGNTTGLLQIAGEELDLDMSQLFAVRLDTNVTPDQRATSSSSSIERGGPQVRAAAAEARRALLLRASQRLGVQIGSLVVAKGVVSIDGEPTRSVSYGELIGDKPFAVKFTGTAPRKLPSQYKLVGSRVPRVDIPDKVAAKYVHMQHVRVPDMLHGRVVRPRGQRAYGSGAKVASLDESSIAHIPGARVVRRGDFVGVVAEREWDAIRAAKALKIAWQDPPPLPEQSRLASVLRDPNRATDTVVVNVGNVNAGFAGAAHVVSANYFSPYQAHAVFGPNCALADVKPDSALVLSSTQDVYASRKMLAALLGLPVERVRVQYYEGSGTYGHSCYEDAPQAAAILSQAVGRPVRVQFMRWDELGWDNYGPAQVAEVRAAIDRDGKIIAYTYDGWQHGWHTDETSTELAWQKTPAERSAGSFSIIVNRMSTGSMYRIANRRVTSHAVPMLGLLKGSPLRSPLDMALSFASEQTIDELAFAAKMDPFGFRRKNMDTRWLGVLEAAAKAAGWVPAPAASRLSHDEVVTGRGIAVGTHHVSYGAAVAEIEVNKRTGTILVKRLYGALDCGLTVNPGLAENQIVGMLVQATSRMLKEEVTFDKTGVTSLDWASYPVLRFAEHPDCVPIVVQRMEEPSTGAGEEVMGAAGAAIANALFDATGARLRQYPLTPDRVRAALAARNSG